MDELPNRDEAMNTDEQSNRAEAMPTVAKWLSISALGVLFFALGLLMWAAIYNLLVVPLELSIPFLAIVLIIGAALLFLIASAWWAATAKTGAKQSFVLYQLVAFLILVLSLLAFALHHREGEGTNNPGSTAATTSATPTTTTTPASQGQHQITTHAGMDWQRNVAEMSAIMVLFLLAELAAFIAHDMIEARRTLRILDSTVGKAAKDTDTASDAITLNLQRLDQNAESIRQLQLVISIATLHPDVFQGTVNLVKAWGDRVPTPSVSINQTTPDGRQFAVSDHCWRILLQEYLKEELYDIAPANIPPNGTPHRIPVSVRPVKDVDLTEEDRKTIKPTDEADVSYIATTVGFYAKLLARLVDDLSKAAAEAGEDQKLCMAIVTNMLPAHCWDWPMSDWSWRSYDPISSYRESMIRAVGKGAEIDRVIMVYADPSDEVQDSTAPEFYMPFDTKTQEGYFWRKALLDKMLADWHRLSPVGADKKDTLICSDNFADANGQIGRTALDSFPPPIKQAAEQKGDSGRVYPIIEGDAPQEGYTDHNEDKWQSKKLSEEYYESLHGRNGKCWMLPLNNYSLNTFRGRHDMMFIGLGPGSKEKKGLWNDKSCDWGICLMSSMNPTTETMLLTVITGKSVGWNYEWCKNRLNETMTWDGFRLYPRLSEEPATPPAEAAAPTTMPDGAAPPGG